MAHNVNVDVKDVTFEVDDFAKNKLVSGPNAEAQQLYILMVSRPGDFEDDPDKGINISQYRFGLADEDAVALKTNIETQVSRYCQFQLSNVRLTYANESLVVALETPSSSGVMLFRTTDDSSVVMQLIKS